MESKQQEKVAQMPTGRPSTHLSRRLNKQFLRNRRNGVLVEAGALDGITNSIGWWFERTLGWEAFNIEPNSISFSLCELNRPDCVNIHAALSNASGYDTLVVPSKSGHGTLAGTKFRGKTRDERVRTLTWRDFIQTFGVEKVDLLILDVEGHELSVASGMNNCEVLPGLICAETGSGGRKRNKDRVLPEEMAEALGPLGYEVAGSDSVNTYFVRK